MFKAADELFELAVHQLSCLEVELPFAAGSRPACTSVQIVGLPRSGTTYFMQLVASQTNLPYVSNLMAIFRSSPMVGLALQSRFMPIQKDWEYTSSLGRTQDAFEPHEWGQFWTEWLGLGRNSLVRTGRDIDWVGLRLLLDRMAIHMGMPFVFKNFYFPAVRREWLAQMPDTVVVFIERSNVEVAESLIAARLQSGNPTSWVGPRTPHVQQVASCLAELQVAAQVAWLDEQIRATRALVDPHWAVEVSYAELVNEPVGCVAKLTSVLSTHGVPAVGSPSLDSAGKSAHDRRRPPTVDWAAAHSAVRSIVEEVPECAWE